FERVFQLADFVQVKGASLENGLLHVDLVREIPEAKKPRQIPLTSGKVLDAKAAKRKSIDIDRGSAPDCRGAFILGVPQSSGATGTIVVAGRAACGAAAGGVTVCGLLAAFAAGAAGAGAAAVAGAGGARVGAGGASGTSAGAVVAAGRVA